MRPFLRSKVYIMNRLQWVSIFGALAVMIGAFGAHALKSSLSEYAIGVYETGVLYHFIHTLAAGLVVALSGQLSSKASTVAVNCFLIGIAVFSGSLYLLAITGISWLGAITPIGGVMFILGWCSVFWAARGIDNGN